MASRASAALKALGKRARPNERHQASHEPQLILSRQFMLPNAKHTPTAFSESSSHFPVAFYIAGELSSPKGYARFWRPSVLWTAMPKTSVHKHGDLCTLKYKIRFPKDERSAPPASDSVFTKNSNEPKFRCAVSSRANARHPLGTLKSGQGNSVARGIHAKIRCPSVIVMVNNLRASAVWASTYNKSDPASPFVGAILLL
jgi:hypothetical protein